MDQVGSLFTNFLILAKTSEAFKRLNLTPTVWFMTFKVLRSARYCCFRLHQRRKEQAKRRRTEKLFGVAWKTKTPDQRFIGWHTTSHCFGEGVRNAAFKKINLHFHQYSTFNSVFLLLLFWVGSCREITLKVAAEASESSFNRLYIRILQITTTQKITWPEKGSWGFLSEDSASAYDARTGNLMLAAREEGGAARLSKTASLIHSLEDGGKNRIKQMIQPRKQSQDSPSWFLVQRQGSLHLLQHNLPPLAVVRRLQSQTLSIQLCVFFLSAAAEDSPGRGVEMMANTHTHWQLSWLMQCFRSNYHISIL